MPDVIPPQVQGFSIPLAELHDVLVSSFLHPVLVLLDASMIIWHTRYSSHFSVIYKFAKDTLPHHLNHQGRC